MAPGRRLRGKGMIMANPYEWAEVVTRGRCRGARGIRSG